MAIDWNDYFVMPLWSGTLGICLMFGIDEDVYKSNQQDNFYDDEYQKIRLHIKQLEADAIAGVIPFQSNGDEFYYNPIKLTEWAIFRRLPVPQKIKEFINRVKQTKEIVKLEINKLEPQAGVVGDDDDTTSSERRHTIWLRETWVKESRPTGAPFFRALKKYKGKEGSLVIDIWNDSPKGHGVKLRTTTGEIELTRKRIQKIASQFRREEKE